MRLLSSWIAPLPRAREGKQRGMAPRVAFDPASPVTLGVTACNRPDLLELTLASFFEHNSFPLRAALVVEDSGIAGVNDAVAAKFPYVTFLPQRPNLGQPAAIDYLYAHVATPYVAHWEDDWETFQGGFLEASMAVLEAHPKISAVMLRGTGRGEVYGAHPWAPLAVMQGDLHDKGWGGYSMNPGLRRMADYRALFPRGFAEVGWDARLAGDSERAISQRFMRAGFYLGVTPCAEGFVRHVGEGRHVMVTH
jgi:hypothetical protein